MPSRRASVDAEILRCDTRERRREEWARRRSCADEWQRVATDATQRIADAVGMDDEVDMLQLHNLLALVRSRVPVPVEGTLRPSPAYLCMLDFVLRHSFEATIGRPGAPPVAGLAALGVFGGHFGGHFEGGQWRDNAYEAYDLADLPPVSPIPWPARIDQSADAPRLPEFVEAVRAADPDAVPLLVTGQVTLFMYLLHECVGCMLPARSSLRQLNRWTYWLCYELSGASWFLEQLRSGDDLDRWLWFA